MGLGETTTPLTAKLGHESMRHGDPRVVLMKCKDRSKIHDRSWSMFGKNWFDVIHIADVAANEDMACIGLYRV